MRYTVLQKDKILKYYYFLLCSIELSKFVDETIGKSYKNYRH